jgi:poly-beta-1,6-N-acetyl-D-glucosamine biosynthesis protein PgaD
VTELVINAPHLQTRSQRIGAVAIAVLGWLLWCYFLFPLVTLGCWLMDDEECSQWVNMSGGYLNLKEILLLYLQTIAVIALIWLFWAIYNLVKRRRADSPAPNPVNCADLCKTFEVDAEALRLCQKSRYAVVHFDQQGRIIGLEAGEETQA